MSKISRIFTGTVYPDSTSYNIDDVLFKVLQYPDSAYILHDKDDVKSHYHFLFRLNQPTTAHKIATELGVDDNVVEYGRDYLALFRYLIHLDNPEKFQYDPDTIQTEVDKARYLSSVSSKDEGSFVLDIVEHFLKSQDSFSKTDVLRYAVVSGQYGLYRRNYQVIKDILF